MCRYNLAIVLASSDRRDEAETAWKQSLADWRLLAQVYPRESEYHSRVGATLSNLAVLAGDRQEFVACRALAEEAIVHQKTALETDPVYVHAHVFLCNHYRQLARALVALKEHRALARAAEESIAYSPVVSNHCCLAANWLADCVELAGQDKQISPAKRLELIDQYARRALAILEKARCRFDDKEAILSFAETYVAVGDKLLASERRNEAQTAWHSARALFGQLRAIAPPDVQSEIDSNIDAINERLDVLTTDTLHTETAESDSATPITARTEAPF
jgi:hypothetical protein